MKRLKNHIILYDAECPMCGWYTGAFVSAGLLDEEGREPYQGMPQQVCPFVDRQRAVNEIALVNTETGEVKYGIYSLFKVIGNAFPVFKPLFRFRPFAWLMSKFYAFVSYNRKVIIPAARQSRQELQPTFRLDYRIAYLLVTVLLSSLILANYAPLFGSIVPAGDTYRELLVCSGQVLFQGGLIAFVDKHKRWDYLGNMMTISFAASLVLLPMLLVSRWVVLPDIVYLGYFMAVAALMLLEHIRRMKILGLGWVMTIGWVVYRLIVLLIILSK